MFRLNMKQMLSIFMAALMVQPSGLWAGSPAAVVGSINTIGMVTVGQTAAPASSTLFAGDTVKTESGNAVVQYSQGARVMLAKSSSAVFSPKTVDLQSGQMSFRTTAAKDVLFNATFVRLEPMSDRTSADVVLNDGKATVSVREGSVRAFDPSGTPLVVIPAGEARLFAMAVPSASAPAASAPAASAAPASASAPTGIRPLLVIGAVVSATLFTVLAATQLDNDDLVEEQAGSLSPIR